MNLCVHNEMYFILIVSLLFILKRFIFSDCCISTLLVKLFFSYSL
jgi:hypothetical protein